MLIKESLDDFKVKEVIDLDLSKGKYVYFLMKKKNWNTLNAIKKISKRANIDIKRIGYAGSKDKNAITEQYISLFDVRREKIETLKIKDIWLKFVGYGDKQIGLGSLKGNSFRITIKDIDSFEKIYFIENYFDEQRFSMGNIDIGKMIVKKQFKEICDKLELGIKKNNYIGALRRLGIRRLQFYLHSYESYIWNKVLVEYLERFEHFKVRYKYGDFTFLKKPIKNFEIPLINYNTEFKDKDIEEIYNKVMEGEKVTKKEFLIKEIPEIITKGASRNIFADVKWESLEFNKNKRYAKAKFYLPKGSYATIVLKKAANQAKQMINISKEFN